tara:strand:+ start:360 stop:491 length:132 start_codon:yes stop_codon:yes gene_type:complete
MWQVRFDRESDEWRAFCERHMPDADAEFALRDERSPEMVAGWL